MNIINKYLDELKLFNERNELLLDDFVIDKLAKYADLLVKKNEVVNLISRQDVSKVIENHILHSILIKIYFLKDVKTCLDFGTGGGLPGIPLAILFPNVEFVLLDSIKKKILSVQHFIQELNIQNANVICTRVESEEIKSEYSQYFDLIISRATVKLRNLVDLNFDLLKKRSCIISLKGGYLSDEIQETQNDYSKFIRSIRLVNLFYKPTNKLNEKDKKLIILEIQK